MPNRLEHERSPYLRQHAHNPVDWFPWGDEAFARAREKKLPILLSIGYSACHWCHVMERESFESPETARAMNEGFVNVKVDREERPDVDALYMRAVQSLGGQGGWPLTIFLTPEGAPFYGGTYFPPEPRHGLPSFPQLLAATRTAWEERRHEVESAAGRIRDLLARSMEPAESGPGGETPVVDAGLVPEAVGEILGRMDPAYGGFGRAPKFPQPVVLEFLLEHHALTGHRPALDAVLLTLRRMARGGIRDHLGGGFHRYAVDQRWLVPHFEKMLYDNALLAGVYVKAHQITGDSELLTVARGIFDDLLGDFRAPEGAFYTARDADSEGEEGLFYLWTPGEVEALLSKDEARLIRRCYDVSEGGNFEGRNILHLAHDLDAVARGEGMSREALDLSLSESLATLKEARASREPPLRDDKILAGWNGLAVRSFAEAGAALGESSYVEAASAAADWLLGTLRPAGRLLHQEPHAGTRIPAFLEDAASLGNALLSLHEATLDPRWLEAAVELDEEVDARYRDGESGLLYDAPDDGDRLLVRPRESSDSPIPSGTSLAAELRMRLARLLGSDSRFEDARAIVAREAPLMASSPLGFGRLLAVAGRLAASPVEVAIAGADDGIRTDLLLREVHRPFLPGRVITGVRRGMDPPFATPLLAGRVPVGDAPTAFVCEHFACRAPTTDPKELAAQLRRVATRPA
ncbi:MAG: thioredoxin domain-containing protein [Gemmatimonadota bacterium]